jgi:ribosomal protein S27AE
VTDRQISSIRLTRDRYREACANKKSLFAPRWEAFLFSASSHFPDSFYVDPDIYVPTTRTVAVAITRTPKGDAFGVAEIDHACKTRPARLQVERFKNAARQKTRYAIAAGTISRHGCEVCGADVAEAHHDDYSEPLHVRWLCRKHHDEFHHCNDQSVAA